MEGLGTTTGRWEVELRREQQPRLCQEQTVEHLLRNLYLIAEKQGFPAMLEMTWILPVQLKLDTISEQLFSVKLAIK